MRHRRVRCARGFLTLPNPWSYGPVFSVGCDTRAGFVHFQPELRYTRWNDSLFEIRTSPTRLNAVQVLIGVAFPK